MLIEQKEYNEKLRYILSVFEGYIDELLTNVLYDDEMDPHYSAVAVNNCIKSLIYIKKFNQLRCDYDDVKEYIIFNGFTAEQAEKFEMSRVKESQYYEGKQF